MEMKNYCVAFVKENGDWDIVDEFEADGDEQANDYAAKNYPTREWYVLDAEGDNING